MKRILILLFFFYSVASFGIQENELNLNAGFGAFGSRGIFGVSIDKFLSQNHALSFAVGLDFIGATSTIGYKYFSEKINTSDSILSKCFMLFDCDSHLYFGPSLQYANGSTLQITGGINEREYQIEPKWLGLVSMGFRDVFKNKITFDLELSYRGILSGGNAIQTGGTPVDDRKSIEMGFRVVGMNVGIGYLF